MWGPMPGSGSELTATEERGITPRVFEQLFARIQQVLIILHLEYCMLLYTSCDIFVGLYASKYLSTSWYNIL
jgi:hypothetical protein